MFYKPSSFNVPLKDILINCMFRGFKAINSEKYREKTARKILRKYFPDESDNVVCFGMNCRSLFYVLMEAMKKKLGRKRKILITPFMHTGFLKILQEHQFEIVSLDIKSDTDCHIQYDFSALDPSMISGILITHVFGSVLQADALFEYAQKHDIPVFEDLIQGTLISSYAGDERSTGLFFSGGQDKIPGCGGGGVCVIRDKALGREMNGILSAYNTQTLKAYIEINLLRLVDWFLHIPFVYLYLAKYLHRRNILMKAFNNKRQKKSGFLHDKEEYLLQPGYCLLQNIRKGFLRDYDTLANYLDQVFLSFTQEIGHEKSAEFFPWFDAEKSHHNLYYHLYTPHPELFLKHSHDLGLFIFPQQSFAICPELFPRASKFLSNLVLLPSLHYMSSNNRHKLSVLLQK